MSRVVQVRDEYGLCLRGVGFRLEMSRVVQVRDEYGLC